MKPAAPGYIPALTGVRFLAGLFVFLFHYKPLKGSGYSWANPLVGVFNEMYTGVGLFFVLSGFLICYTYYASAKFEKGFLKKYFTRRFARIFPIFFILTTLYFVYWAFHGKDDPKFIGIYLFNITLIKGFSESLMFTGIFQTWSLTVEETFYFLAPAIFLLHRKHRILWGQVPVIIGIGLLCTLFFYYFPFLGFFNTLNFLFMSTFFGRCIEFFMGMQLALLVLRSGNPASLPQFTRFPLATAGGIIMMAACLYGMSILALEMNTKYGMQSIAGMFANNILFPLSVTIFFYGLIYERSWVQAFFASRPVELLGKSSYAFYLIHAGFVADFIYPLTHNSFYTFILLEALAIAIFLLIERPLYRLITGTGKAVASPQPQYQVVEPGC